MEDGIVAYLTYQLVGAQAPSGIDAKMWGSEKPPECPPIFELYRRLKLYGEQLPWLSSGIGYFNQPYIYSQLIEQCIIVEQNFLQVSAAIPPTAVSGR